MQVNDIKIDHILPRVLKPGRYVGNELHIIRKSRQEADVFVVLAFPDVYEIGMSHVGMQTLYHVLNGPDWLAAERVYTPWPDMEAAMRDNAVPLYSLENYTPIAEFDVLGFSLQYELQYTNILTMLDLAGIPFYSRDRDERYPLVIAGGPNAFNPEPLAPFFDAVVLGDGEETALELATVVRSAKKAGLTRRELLEKLAVLEGVYVPSFYENTAQGVDVQAPAPAQVRARMVSALKPEYYPEKPLVPQIEVTHDRFSLEVMRGCTRGCRFCNAGMIYRPLRPRSVDDLVTHTKKVMANTGYDEVSLVSLSTSDYPGLPQLLTALRQWADEQDVALSFPSLRSETFTEEMADMAQGLRRSGLTLAPEAGTQRLRDVINKNNTEEDLLRAVDIAFKKGWRHVKLYFMVGLPTETEEDLQGIIELVQKVVQAGRQYGRKDVHVSLSPFAPKPHTPFQWERQASPKEIDEKVYFIRNQLKWTKAVKLSWRDSKIALLESVMGRGDRRLAPVIEQVYREGGRFDAWSDYWDFQRWETAFEAHGLSMSDYTREREPGKALPWSHLSKGISEAFLVSEREASLKGASTPDCREDACQGCGLMNEAVCRQPGETFEQPHTPTAESSDGYGRKARKEADAELTRKVRVAYEKGAAARYTGHLAVMKIFRRALKRAGLQVAMSQGYHAHPKISSGPPLPLGATSQAEYMDIELINPRVEEFVSTINGQLPDGLHVTAASWFFQKAVKLNAVINRQAYSARLTGDWDAGQIQESIERFMGAQSHVIERFRKGRTVSVDIRPLVESLQVTGDAVEFVIKQSDSGTARPSEVLETIWPLSADGKDIWLIERLGQYHFDGTVLQSPLDLIQES